MNPDLRAKLEDNLSRHKDITDKLSTPEVYSNQSQMKSLNQELTKLEPSIKLFQKYLNIEKSILDTKELLHDEDKEMIAIARQELRQHEIELKNIESKIIEATVEKDPTTQEIYSWRYVQALAEGGCHIRRRPFQDVHEILREK